MERIIEDVSGCSLFRARGLRRDEEGRGGKKGKRRKRYTLEWNETDKKRNEKTYQNGIDEVRSIVQVVSMSIEVYLTRICIRCIDWRTD
jgi:hypothetical protein